jgi:hypothetical protein
MSKCTCILLPWTLLGALIASAAAQQPAPNNLFTASGFVVRYADTPATLAHLQRLPPDKLVTI